MSINSRQKYVCDGKSSQSCGYGCIDDEDTCRGTIQSSISSKLIKFAKQFQKQKPAKEAIASLKPTMPKDVIVTRRKSTTGETVDQYTFSVGKSKVSMYAVDYWLGVAGGSDLAGEVGFTVNKSYEVSDVKKSAKESAAIALKLARIITFDASQRPDGYKYYTNATTGDGNEFKRAIAFQRLGFSRPVDGLPGEAQYATVKNGKLTPDLDKLVSSDIDSQSTIDSRMAENKRYRKAQKQE